MPGINWPSIAANFAGVAAVFVGLLAAVVAVEAKRLQWASQEGVPITPMGFDVIGNGSGNDTTEGEAHAAQRLALALSAGDAAPALELIPVTVTTIVLFHGKRVGLM